MSQSSPAVLFPLAAQSLVSTPGYLPGSAGVSPGQARVPVIIPNPFCTPPPKSPHFGSTKFRLAAGRKGEG